MIDPLLAEDEPRHRRGRSDAPAPQLVTPVHPTSEEPADHRLVTINDPPTGFPLPNLGDVVRAREVLYFLTWRDVKVRYKQTAIGAAWAILQPLLGMLIFTLVFRRLASLHSDGVPYPIFAYCALVPWTFFSTALTQASQSLVTNEKLVTKVYFPRLVIPLAAVGGVLVDLGLATIVLVVLMLVYGVAPSVGLVTVPLLVLIASAAAVGLGAFFAALNVRYRDVRYVIPFLVQLWLFVTPVAYSINLVPGRWRWAYALNPMVGVVEGFRWAFLGIGASGRDVAIACISAAAMFVVGLLVFRRMEDTFADEI
jgi:lipopolysaccharide transport system permease protein